MTGQACPFWVPLIEYNEADSPGADYFVKKRMDQLMLKDPDIDTIILGCTHYPILMPKILKYTKPGVTIVPQGEYVASSLKDYLRRHPEMDTTLTRAATTPPKVPSGSRKQHPSSCTRTSMWNMWTWGKNEPPKDEQGCNHQQRIKESLTSN